MIKRERFMQQAPNFPTTIVAATLSLHFSADIHKKSIIHCAFGAYRCDQLDEIHENDFLHWEDPLFILERVLPRAGGRLIVRS